MVKKNDPRIRIWLALLIGSAGSLYFMFRTASKQPSVLLMGLFTAWVLSPFLGLLLAERMVSPLKTSLRQRFYWLSLALTILSLTAYNGSIRIASTKPAFIFLLIPFLSWIAMLTVWVILRRSLPKGDNQGPDQTL
jgi:hypothetical protein